MEDGVLNLMHLAATLQLWISSWSSTKRWVRFQHRNLGVGFPTYGDDNLIGFPYWRWCISLLEAPSPIVSAESQCVLLKSRWLLDIPLFLGKSEYLFDMFCCFWLKTKLPDVPWFQVDRSYMFHMVMCNFLSFTTCFTGSWSNSTGFFTARWGSLAFIRVSSCEI